MALADRFNLEKQFTFYASYHHDPINKAIHFLCIWPILSTAIMMLADTAPLMSSPEFLKDIPVLNQLVFNWSIIVLVVYVPWYLILDRFAGGIGATMIISIYFASNYFSQVSMEMTGLPAWQVALPVHVTCWIIQFIGHGVFEHRSPALLHSLDQAIITAPLFVLLEMLFPLGYKPEMYRRMMKIVEMNVLEFHAHRTKKVQ